jgi:hypothetical protein
LATWPMVRILRAVLLPGGFAHRFQAGTGRPQLISAASIISTPIHAIMRTGNDGGQPYMKPIHPEIMMDTLKKISIKSRPLLANKGFCSYPSILLHEINSSPRLSERENLLFSDGLIFPCPDEIAFTTQPKRTLLCIWSVARC